VKINGAYYRDDASDSKAILPVMREICGESLIFQQGMLLLTESVGQSTF